VLFNIGQCEWTNSAWYAKCQADVEGRIRANEESYQISGLRGLKSLLGVFEFELNENRKPLNQLIEKFFPVLEDLMGRVSSNSPNYIYIMVLICKNFYIANHVSTPA